MSMPLLLLQPPDCVHPPRPFDQSALYVLGSGVGVGEGAGDGIGEGRGVLDDVMVLAPGLGLLVEEG